MSNYNNLRAEISRAIKENGNQEITGKLLQGKLIEMIDSLGEGYSFKGIATPNGEPISTDANVFYIANEVGQYPYYGGLSVEDGEIAILCYNGKWEKMAISDIASKEVLEETKNKVDNLVVQDLGDAEDKVVSQKELTPLLYNAVANSGIKFKNIIRYNKYYNVTSGELENADTYDCTYKIKVYGDVAVDTFKNIINIFYWDKDGNYINNETVRQQKEIHVFPINETVGYVSFNFRKATYNENEYLNFIFYSSTEFVKLTEELNEKNETLTTEVDIINDKIDTKVDKKSFNLFDESTISEGYLNTNGTLTVYQNYITSDYISVEEGKTYYNSIEAQNKFRMVGMFNENKVFLRDYFLEEVNEFTIPKNANIKYVRVSYYKDLPKQLSEIPTRYTPYNPISGNLYTLIQYPLVNAEVDKSTVLNKNIFVLKNNIIHGWFSNNSGNFVISDIFSRTLYLQVDKTSYRFKSLIPHSINCYDENKTFLSQASIVFVNETEGNITLANNTKFIVVNCITEKIDIENAIIFNFEDYIDTSNTTSTQKDNLYGKKWVVVGDSFSQWSDKQYTEGQFYNQYITYKFEIAERCGIQIVDMTVSGRTMAYPADGSFSNAFANPEKYQSIPEDVDYITIMLGINDTSKLLGYSQDGEDTTGKITLGDINSTDTSSFYGAWNVVLEWIAINRPLAHVGIIIGNGLGNNNPNGSYSDKGMDIYTALKNIVKKWNVPYIDFNGGDGKTPMMHRGIYPEGTPTSLITSKWNAFSTSPVQPYNGHTNAIGHKYMSYSIEQFLRSL